MGVHDQLPYRVERVALRGLRFHVRVGILPHEREIPQPLELDVEVEPGESAIVDYREVYDAARSVMAREPLDYLEEIGRDIGRAVLQRVDAVSIRVTVRKPHVPLGGPVDCAEVIVVVHRG